MGCEHVQLRDGSVAIVCGLVRGKVKRCQFCGARGTKLCDWKTDKPVKIPHYQVSADDTVVTVQHKYRLKAQGLQRFEVDWSEYQAGLTGPFPVTVTMYGLVFPDGRCWLYYHTGTPRDRQVTVLRPGTCDAPCCELHSRSVGEDTDYCREHWTAWETL